MRSSDDHHAYILAWLPVQQQECITFTYAHGAAYHDGDEDNSPDEDGNSSIVNEDDASEELVEMQDLHDKAQEAALPVPVVVPETCQRLMLGQKTNQKTSRQAMSSWKPRTNQKTNHQTDNAMLEAETSQQLADAVPQNDSAPEERLQSLIMPKSFAKYENCPREDGRQPRSVGYR